MSALGPLGGARTENGLTRDGFFLTHISVRIGSEAIAPSCTADLAGDLTTDLRKARANPIFRPRRSGGRGNGHSQATGVGATGFAGAGEGAVFSSGMTSSQRV